MVFSDHRTPAERERTRPIEIVIRPGAVARFCAAGIAILLAMHVAVEIARFGFGRDYLMGLAQKMYLGAEASIPNWFSTLLLLACGIALLAIGAAAREYAAHWVTLGVIFLALSLDESAALHDLLAPLFTGTMAWLARNIGGPFAGLQHKPGYAWLIPGLAFCLAVSLFYLPFLLSLPQRVRSQFVLAAAIYVGGAAGFEVIGGWYSGLFGSRNLTFATLLTIEETMEMAGASFFLYTLLAYVARESGEIRVRLG
jgi:hypothetical protein